MNGRTFETPLKAPSTRTRHWPTSTKFSYERRPAWSIAIAGFASTSANYKGTTDLALASEDEHGISTPNDQDFVKNHSLCLLRYYFILLDFKNALSVGSSQRLATLHKLLVPHLKSLPGFNAYAIEMMISVIQNEVFSGRNSSVYVGLYCKLEGGGGRKEH